ncbi:hypothetical protein GCM10009799_14270 [Nocardiopsis rhodophaea]|uniref:Uncharacterized protein n=1 Tax=Nocardiopsis rhodophaea TaxID=280238 RepID=A0ABN2SN81_9ACTN
MLTPWSDSNDTKVCRSSRAVHSSGGSPEILQARAQEGPLCAVWACPLPRFRTDR